MIWEAKEDETFDFLIENDIAFQMYRIEVPFI